MLRIMLVLILLIGLSGGVVNAQEDDSYCQNPTALALILENAGAAVRGETDDDMTEALLIAQLAIESWRARCENGLVFTNETYPDGVTDPIQFPDGVYRTHLVADGPVTFDLTALSGRCGDTYLYLNTGGGEDEGVSQMTGCIAVIDIDSGGFQDVPVTWSLEYIPIVTTGGN